MAEPKTNNELIKKSLHRMFPSCFVYALIIGFIYMVDTILAGSMIDAQAIAAVAIGLPAYGIFLSVAHSIVHGTAMRMTWLMGRGDHKNYSRAFSGGLYFSLITSLVFALVLMVFTHTAVMLFGGAKAETAIIDQAVIYVRSCVPMIVFFALSGVVREAAGIAGHQNVKVYCSILNIAVNVVLSIAFVLVMPVGMKIVGLGLASSIAAFTEFVYGVIMIKVKKVKVSFRMCILRGEEIKETLDTGVPSSLDEVIECIAAGFINNIILSGFPGEPLILSVVAVVSSIRKFGKTAGNGVGYASIPLFGVLYSERDKAGLKKAFSVSMKFGLVVSSVWALIVIGMTPFLSALYGMSLNSDIMIGSVIVLLLLPAFFALHLVICFYDSTERDLLSLFLAAFPDSVLYPIMLIVMIPMFGKSGIWLAMGSNCIFGILALWLLLMAINKTTKLDRDRFFMLKPQLMTRVPALDITITNTNEDVSYISDKIYSFLEDSDTSARTTYIAALCTEELAADITEHFKDNPVKNKKFNRVMDIKMFNDADSLEIIIRNMGVAYDPLDFETDTVSFRKMGVKMAQDFAREIIYSYVYKLNVISMTLDKQSDNKSNKKRKNRKKLVRIVH